MLDNINPFYRRRKGKVQLVRGFLRKKRKSLSQIKKRVIKAVPDKKDLSRIKEKVVKVLPKKKKKDPNLLGEGKNGRVIAKSPFTIRKEYKKRRFLDPARKLLDGKTAWDREYDIQKILAKKGLAPKVKRKGERFIEMERVYGKTIDSKMKNGEASDRTQRKYGRKLAKQIKRVHDAGVSHNDLHGENVMVGPFGGMKVIDYGWASSKGRPLTMRERRKDYKRVLDRHKGKKYKAFRDSFEESYKP
jgi:predicted Ser/Thr protein kinase